MIDIAYNTVGCRYKTHRKIAFVGSIIRAADYNITEKGTLMMGID